MTKRVNDRWHQRKPTTQDKMLADFLRAKTPMDKKRVIEMFNPMYFLLEPTKETDDGDTLQG